MKGDKGTAQKQGLDEEGGGIRCRLVGYDEKRGEKGHLFRIEGIRFLHRCKKKI